MSNLESFMHLNPGEKLKRRELFLSHADGEPITNEDLHMLIFNSAHLTYSELKEKLSPRPRPEPLGESKKVEPAASLFSADELDLARKKIREM